MSWGEIFLILVVALIVIGPEKMPEVARGLAKTVRQVQRMAGELRDAINLEEIRHQASQNPTTPPLPPRETPSLEKPSPPADQA